MPPENGKQTNEENLVFYGILIGPLISGQCLIISGVPKAAAQFLRIQLFSRNDVINLSLDILFNQNIIKRSAYINNECVGEEIDENLAIATIKNPIEINQTFTINIIPGDEKFHISINSKPYCTFGYVMPKEKVQAIRIYGDIAVLRKFDHRQLYPSPIPKVVSDHVREVCSSQVPKRFNPGNIIILQGILSGKRNGHFVIYFTEDTKIKSCALYFDARFPNYSVFLNCMDPQFRRQNEIRIEKFPFRIQEPFRMVIAFTTKLFRIAINGEQFCSLPYRKPDLLQDMNGFKIRTRYGMDFNVSMIAHLELSSPECKGYEIFSEI